MFLARAGVVGWCGPRVFGVCVHTLRSDRYQSESQYGRVGMCANVYC